MARIEGRDGEPLTPQARYHANCLALGRCLDCAVENVRPYVRCPRCRQVQVARRPHVAPRPRRREARLDPQRRAVATQILRALGR